jgi:hypothetical protein
MKKEIEIGDTVQLKKRTVFGGLKVLSIEGENAICSFYVLDKPLDGNARPTSLLTEESIFPLKDLIISRKGKNTT